ncbi:hypothetical protein QVD17_03249 [Tagetes erecta]|uniref:HMA domain-containing protein n=1 Tax=Tagetes erecta TaxID=13708 RepID=A0AAD8LAM5_TARER|nr:hypothetical protein QVD17_03249 [Tagetes erecta]
MGRQKVRNESKDPAKRSRVWRDKESYSLLRKGDGSDTVEGLALNMGITETEAAKQGMTFEAIKTSVLVKMKNLKYLNFSYVALSGSYENFPELIWLIWYRCQLKTIPPGLMSSSLVAIHMKHAEWETFDPPTDLHSLKILDLIGSYKLVKICNLYRLPKLERLVLGKCMSLIHVCHSIGNLENLSFLNLQGCAKFWTASSNRQTLFPLPQSLSHLDIENNPFEKLPSHINLTMVRELYLRFCTNLKSLQHLPVTLEELNVDWCSALENIRFESARFTLRVFNYEGCFNLSDIQGLFKLVSVAELDEADLGHMKWAKMYDNHKVDLVGDMITKGRRWKIQMLYEYGIRSIYLQGIKDQSMTPHEYTSSSELLSFHVPSHTKKHMIKGLSVTFLYQSSGDHKDMLPPFVKISNKTKDVTLVYSPVVYCKPTVDNDVVWLSYWPIGNMLDVGNEVHVNIFLDNRVMIARGCGASLVYVEDGELVKEENCEMSMGDLSELKVTEGGYYLCRYNFFNSTIPDWLYGHNIQIRDSRRWRTPSESIPALYHLENTFRNVNRNKIYADLGVSFSSESETDGLKKALANVAGVESYCIHQEHGRLRVFGRFDPQAVATCVREFELIVQINNGVSKWWWPAMVVNGQWWWTAAVVIDSGGGWAVVVADGGGSQRWYETIFIPNIVKKIHSELGLKVSSTWTGLIGVETRAEDITTWLRSEQHDHPVLAISDVDEGACQLQKVLQMNKGSETIEGLVLSMQGIQSEALNSLKILELSYSYNLGSICSIHRLPNLERLGLCNCTSLTHVCKTIVDLKNLHYLNLGKCTKLWKTSSNQKFVNQLGTCRRVSEQPSFCLPQSLTKLTLADNKFKMLPNHIDLNLILELNLTCSINLKSLPCLPSMLKNLYVDWCILLENIRFQSACFTLERFSYEGCFKLCEIEGLFKLVPIATLDEADMQWIKVYQDCEVDLVGDMLYEYGIRSIYLQGIKDKSLIKYDYTTSSGFLSFRVPLHPMKKRIKGVNVMFVYRSPGRDYKPSMLPPFVKISNITKGVTWVYNPVVFCKPKVDDTDVLWISSWPIKNTFDTGDEVHVAIYVNKEQAINVSECGASLVYMDDCESEKEEKCVRSKEMMGRDLSFFEVTKGGYYLCRRDLFKSMIPDWFFGYNIHITDSRRWRICIGLSMCSEWIIFRNPNRTRLEVTMGVSFNSGTETNKIEKAVSSVEGVESVSIHRETRRLVAIGRFDIQKLVWSVRQFEDTVQVFGYITL